MRCDEDASIAMTRLAEFVNGGVVDSPMSFSAMPQARAKVKARSRHRPRLPPRPPANPARVHGPAKAATQIPPVPSKLASGGSTREAWQPSTTLQQDRPPAGVLYPGREFVANRGCFTLPRLRTIDSAIQRPGVQSLASTARKSSADGKAGTDSVPVTARQPFRQLADAPKSPRAAVAAEPSSSSSTLRPAALSVEARSKDITKKPLAVQSSTAADGDSSPDGDSERRILADSAARMRSADQADHAIADVVATEECSEDEHYSDDAMEDDVAELISDAEDVPEFEASQSD